MNKRYAFLLFFFLFLCPINIVGQDEDDSRGCCDVDFAFCDSPEITAIINQTAWNIERSCDKYNALATFVEFGGVKLLQQNFFARSNNLNSRSLLDYPEFLPFRHDQDKRGFTFNLFYNQTNALYFTSNSANICSYLAISEPGFIEALQSILNTVKGFQPDLNVNEIINTLLLFQPFRVEERRLGFMFFAKEKFGHWHAQVWWPLFYLERNHNVDDKVRIEIENAVAQFTGIPPDEVDEAEQKKFQEAHFISDKLGFGDMRFMVDHPVFKTIYWTMRVGGLLTVPASFALTKGIKGSSFCRLSIPPTLDFCDLFTRLANPTPVENVTNLQAAQYMLSALDNLNAILLDSPFDHHGHPEIGIYMKNKFPVSKYISALWCRRLVWRSFTALQYQLPAWEQRSYMIPVDLGAFSQYDFNVSTDTTEGQVQADANFNFILQQFNERLFPVALNTKVHPGFIFRMCSNICYEAPKGGFSVGSDTWIRSGERFSNIEAIPYASCDSINIQAAKAPFAYQAKVYGSIFFKREKPGAIWAIGLNGDYTYWNKGIGQDYSLMFMIDVTF